MQGVPWFLLWRKHHHGKPHCWCCPSEAVCASFCNKLFYFSISVFAWVCLCTLVSAAHCNLSRKMWENVLQGFLPTIFSSLTNDMDTFQNIHLWNQTNVRRWNSYLKNIHLVGGWIIKFIHNGGIFHQRILAHLALNFSDFFRFKAKTYT